MHFLGVDPDQSGDDNEEGPARKKVCLPVESVPLAYNYAQHRVPGQSSLFVSLIEQSIIEHCMLKVRRTSFCS